MGTCEEEMRHNPTDLLHIGRDRLDEINREVNEEMIEIAVDTLKVTAMVLFPPLLLFKTFRDAFDGGG